MEIRVRNLGYTNSCTILAFFTENKESEHLSALEVLYVIALYKSTFTYLLTYLYSANFTVGNILLTERSHTIRFTYFRSVRA